MPGSQKAARLPPRWFMTSFWKAHRLIIRLTGGRLGLWRPKPGGWGAARLTTTGRRSGEERSVMIGYFEDGPNLVTLAMNGWAPDEPKWWLNLQADPDARIDIVGESRLVTAKPARGAERERLWERWRQTDKALEEFAARRPHETAVVVFEPRESAARRRQRTTTEGGQHGDTSSNRPIPGD